LFPACSHPDSPLKQLAWIPLLSGNPQGGKRIRLKKTVIKSGIFPSTSR
jgi:hypothetical protein